MMAAPLTSAAAAAALFVRVAELLGLARKVLHYAQTETGKARDEYAHTDARTRDAERRLPQLAFLSGELGGQAQVPCACVHRERTGGRPCLTPPAAPSLQLLSRLATQLSDAHDAAFAVYEVCARWCTWRATREQSVLSLKRTCRAWRSGWAMHTAHWRPC
jgi:hypothetical protein